jgi:hypothetical protein
VLNVLLFAYFQARPLLTNKATLHDRSYQSSVLKGTFKLRKDDEIEVRVAYPSYLNVFDIGQNGNVFGLFKL